MISDAGLICKVILLNQALPKIDLSPARGGLCGQFHEPEPLAPSSTSGAHASNRIYPDRGDTQSPSFPFAGGMIKIWAARVVSGGIAKNSNRHAESPRGLAMRA